MEAALLTLQGLHDKLLTNVDMLNESIEPSKYFLFCFKYFRQLTNVAIMHTHAVACQASFRWPKTLMSVVVSG